MALRQYTDECERCHGRGRGPWQPDNGICYECGGKGAAEYYESINVTYVKRWFCKQEGTPAKFSVRLTEMSTKRHNRVYLKVRIKGTDQNGHEMDRVVEGHASVNRVMERFHVNESITKTLTRDDFMAALRMKFF